jgi:hypothetical protein
MSCLSSISLLTDCLGSSILDDPISIDATLALRHESFRKLADHVQLFLKQLALKSTDKLVAKT